jgi:hypothetical protein
MYTDILQAFYSVETNSDVAVDESTENKQLIDLSSTFALLWDLQMFHSQRANFHIKVITVNAVCIRVTLQSFVLTLTVAPCGQANTSGADIPILLV